MSFLLNYAVLISALGAQPPALLFPEQGVVEVRVRRGGRIAAHAGHSKSREVSCDFEGGKALQLAARAPSLGFRKVPSYPGRGPCVPTYNGRGKDRNECGSGMKEPRVESEGAHCLEAKRMGSPRSSRAPI
jgi:hypothetical protein